MTLYHHHEHKLLFAVGSTILSISSPNDHELRYEVLSNRPLSPKRQLPNPPPDHPWRWKLVGSVRAQKRLDKLFDRQYPKPYHSTQPKSQLTSKQRKSTIRTPNHSTP